MAKDGPGGEKTEKPTAQKLKQARKDGQIPRTQELGTWLDEMGYRDVDEARGAMSFENVPDPHAWERVNYARILEGWGSGPDGAGIGEVELAAAELELGRLAGSDQAHPGPLQAPRHLG